MNNFISGANLDLRSDKAKSTDYKIEEIASSFPVNWEEKSVTKWKKYPIRTQNGSGSCVAQTAAKILGIENKREEGRFVKFSATPVYQKRINKDTPGMSGHDAMRIISKYPTTLEEFIPSQNLSEVEINKPIQLTESDKRIGEIFKTGGYIDTSFDIDKIASVLDQDKGVMLFFYFKYDEWIDVPILKYKNENDWLRHSVTGVDYTLWEGKKSLIIDDSWGEFYGFEGQRIITEDFLKERIFFSSYAKDLSNDGQVKDEEEKPKHEFKSKLQFSEIFNINEEVKWLQKCLRYEGLFPKDISITGYYGSITAKAVYEFQVKYNIDSIEELNSLEGKVVGPKTREVLNQIYG